LLSELLPAIGGRQSLELALEGMKGQSWEHINKVALSARAESKTISPAERKVMRTQVEKFLDKKKTADDELALRGALKVLGFLELEDSADTLLPYLSPKWPTAVRIEAVTSLRFALAGGASKKAVRKLMELLNDSDSLVLRAARETLTVLKFGPEFSEELAELVGSPDNEVGLWAIERLGALAPDSKLAAKTLLPVASSDNRAKAEAASKVLASLKNGEALLVEALATAIDEVGAHVLSEALNPLASKLGKKDLQKLLQAGAEQLGKSFAIAKRQLEPVRIADPEGWAQVLREKAKAVGKKDPARAEAISELLGRSSVASSGDRFGAVLQRLQHHSLDLHPRARQRDTVLMVLERLHAEGFKVAEAVNKDKKLTDEARYYLGVHFAEKPQFDLKGIGAEVLEQLASKGKGKLAKAAKNKMKLLEL
ncbi:MAG: lyase domain protein repeat-containing protein, partial [Myxococcaceae bacterium]|nr:lyase domain protein repeat-containing protein [Myxococcaceae bacterium]